MKAAKELELEDYVDFYNSGDADPLSLQQLKKILWMNGFCWRQMSKSRIADLLRTVELMPPGRSTVGECLPRSSTCAELSLADVMKDVASIRWQACPIVSILMISNESAESAVEGIAPISTFSSSGRSKKKRKRKGPAKQTILIRVVPDE